MFQSDYKWQHDYVRLALDTGFCFEKHKPDNFDKNKISSIDIDRIIEERDIATIEHLIPSVTKFVLDPEQAQILDINFVKTFRLSQLSIQYLLFCKKYLDNSLIIIKGEVKKLKEENEELNLFVNDLKTHISTLMKEIDEKPTFKCTQCNKIFSSEEFLNSHIKRRHSSPLKETETDKLQMEIKELKGRLNDAEKMIQKEQNEMDEKLPKETELKKIEELQQKFEDLRLQVQSELKILQTQHNFQEKYEKWFEKMALHGTTKHVERGGGDLERRRESTTQTDLETDLQETAANFEEKNKENIPEISNAQKRMTELGEALETKVTCSLQKIENQMQSFWNKLSEMERYKKKDSSKESEDQKPKPMVRSKRKYSVQNLDMDDVDNNVEHASKNEREVCEKEEIKQATPKHKHKIEEMKESKSVPKVKIVATQLKQTPQVQDKVESEVDDDTTTSETITSEPEVPDSPKKEKILKPLPLPRKRPHSSSKISKDEIVIVNDELLKHFQSEVEKIIMGRLQDLGVSPEWKGLPTRSYQRVMEIVDHQANLLKKTYPNFDFISTQIEKNVDKKIKDTNTKQKQRKLTKPKKPEAKKMGELPSPRIEIKNRQMYDTDSESEIKPVPVKESLRQFSAPYSAVIEELKVVTSKIESGENLEAKEVGVKSEDQTKGVLKSYPSVGSLTKKKVLFNLNTDDDPKDSVKDGGSSTSIASSVFDGTPRKEDDKKRDREKDIEDLSDFDFSDM